MTESTKLTVLVADDSPLIRKAFTRILGDNYQLIETADGEEAWETLQNNQSIDAVFCDMKMPHISGIDLLQKMRSSNDPNFQSMPIVLLISDSDDEALRHEALETGATDFITKPFDSAELKARAKSHVHSHVERKSSKHLATMDPVTRLGNKQFFLARGGQMVSFANRHRTDLSLSLVKIDQFDSLTKGHPEREERLLKTVGDFIAQEVRTEDTIARIEGGLFGLMLASTDVLGAIHAAQRVQEQVNETHFDIDGESIQLTISTGISAPYSHQSRELPAMVEEAKQQLQHALAQGDSIYPEQNSLKPPEPESVDSLDECLKLINNSKNGAVDAEHLINQMFPLLAYCDKRLGLRLSESVLHLIKRSA